jgi:hypothetical protein
MKRWPAEAPPKVKRPINLEGPPPDPVTFDGPLNVLIALHGIALANINVSKTKAEYDDINPQGTPVG